MDDRRASLMLKLESLRSEFPEWGFFVGIAEYDTNKIWGWSNIKEPNFVVEYFAKKDWRIEKWNAN